MSHGLSNIIKIILISYYKKHFYECIVITALINTTCIKVKKKHVFQSGDQRLWITYAFVDT